MTACLCSLVTFFPVKELLPSWDVDTVVRVCIFSPTFWITLGYDVVLVKYVIL